MKDEIYSKLASLNRLINEPARLAIMAALYDLEEADFVFLHRITGLTRGNLSSHIYKLAEGGYVEVEKKFIGKKPTTVCRLTEKGRKAFEEYLKTLQPLIERHT